MDSVIKTTSKIKEMKLEPIVGTHIKDVLKDALMLASFVDGNVIVRFNKLDFYIDKTDTLEDLLKVWHEYLHTKRVRIISDYEISQFRRIRIIGIRNVKAKYGGEKGHIGFLAKDEKERLYFNNFEEFADDTNFFPYGVWITKPYDDSVFFWYDVMWNFIPLKKRELIAKEFPDLFAYCKKHNCLFWKDDKCFYCHLEEMSILTDITTA